MLKIRTLKQQLKDAFISDGSHSIGDGAGITKTNACVMELASLFSAEQHKGDHPNCVLPVIRNAMIEWNDATKLSDEERQDLKQLIPYMLETNWYQLKITPKAVNLVEVSGRTRQLQKELAQDAMAACVNELFPFLFKLSTDKRIRSLSKYRGFDSLKLVQKELVDLFPGSKFDDHEVANSVGLDALHIIVRQANSSSTRSNIESVLNFCMYTSMIANTKENQTKIRKKVISILVTLFKSAQYRSIQQRRENGVFDPHIAAVDGT